MQTYQMKGETIFVPSLKTYFPNFFFIREGFSLYGKEKNEIISQLYVRLMEKLNIPVEQLELSRYYGQGDFDIAVKNKKGKAEILIEVIEPKNYEKEMETKIKNLFEAGAKENDKNIKTLLYWTHEFEKGKLKRKFTAINFKKYKTFEAWKNKGNPGEKLSI